MHVLVLSCSIREIIQRSFNEVGERATGQRESERKGDAKLFCLFPRLHFTFVFSKYKLLLERIAISMISGKP